jgi:hypothetical protein
MKWLIVLTLAFSFQSASAQNLGQAYDWLKDSYKKIPVASGMPYYDTLVSGVSSSYDKLSQNAMYFAEQVLQTEEISKLDKPGYSIKGSYQLYTNDRKDEEHTYTVNFKIDVAFKGGKYSVDMHDFHITFLGNKVEFGLKYKGAKNNNGSDNQFMAIFHALNEKQIKKLCETMSMDMLPAEATASN